MILLAIDTAASLCAACVYDSEGGERGRAVFDIGKGHAERLMDVIATALDEAGIGYGDLDAVAVAVGPGSFTGVRVGVATARGFALALKIPAVGVTTLEALAAEALLAHPGSAVIAAIDAGRGQVYLQRFAGDGKAVDEPAVLATEAAAALVRDASEGKLLAGSAARMLGGTLAVASDGATADIATYARLAAGRLAANPSAGDDKPKPLYLRDADAKPQGAFALPRKAEP
jgi:tRNA threonylcarbamoyladenosine biosynthesis protein TsaB